MANSYVFRVVDGHPQPNLIMDADFIPSAINHSVDYVKTTAGAPTGTPASGEKCLNTNEAKLYTESTGAWDAGVAVSANQKFIHKDTGSDTSGNSGTYTASEKIYTYRDLVFIEFTPTEGIIVWIMDEDELYVYSGSDWVTVESTTTHNSLNGIQGGSATERYHTNADQYNAINNAPSPTSTNTFLVKSQRAMVPVVYSFALWNGIGQSQTDKVIYDSPGIRSGIVMPKPGSIVATVLQSSSARTAGTCTMEPTINGSDVSGNDLDLTLDGTNPSKDYADVAPGTTGLTFVAGNELGAHLSTDPSWATAAGNENAS